MWRDAVSPLIAINTIKKRLCLPLFGADAIPLLLYPPGLAGGSYITFEGECPIKIDSQSETKVVKHKHLLTFDLI